MGKGERGIDRIVPTWLQGGDVPTVSSLLNFVLLLFLFLLTRVSLTQRTLFRIVRFRVRFFLCGGARCGWGHILPRLPGDVRADEFGDLEGVDALTRDDRAQSFITNDLRGSITRPSQRFRSRGIRRGRCGRSARTVRFSTGSWRLLPLMYVQIRRMIS